MSSIKLRKDATIEYVGRESSTLSGSRLPTTRQVLCHFVYLHRQKHTIRDSARLVIRELNSKFWSKTRIPVIQEILAIQRIESLYKQWKSLLKSKGRNSKPVAKFTIKLDNLFDIGKKNAVATMRNLIKEEKNPAVKTAMEEEIKFYTDQMDTKKRVSIIGGVDSKLKTVQVQRAKRQENKTRRQDELQEKSAKEKENREKTGAVVTFESEDSDEAVASTSGVKKSAQVDDYTPARRAAKPKKDVNSPEMAQVLDASKVSNCQATLLMSAAAQSYGVDVNDTTLSVSTTRRKRIMHREDEAKRQKSDFQPDDVLVLHWDGKIVPALTGKEQVDRQAVLVTGKSTNQLLGVPIVPGGKGAGKAIANIIVGLLYEWRCFDSVKALCFDTTSLNSGWRNGIAANIERASGIILLWLACRHHILELILEASYLAVMQSSQSPDIDFFKGFQKRWGAIKKNPHDLPENYPTVLDSKGRSELITFAENRIKIGQPRDDYLELLELCIIFLGGTPPRGVRFREPGAVHKARWMARAIYSLKIYLFRKGAKLDSQVSADLLDVCYFIVECYIEAWFDAPYAPSAPRSDLELIRRLGQFSSVNDAIATAGLKKFSGHLYYLSEELIGLSIFDEGLPDEDREALADAIQTKIGEDDPMKKRNITVADMPSTAIRDLGTVNTQEFFRTLGIETDFLSLPVPQWCSTESYKRGKEVCMCLPKKIVDNLAVVNDHAERKVKLSQDYNKFNTHDEENYQNLLLTVDEHRKTTPNLKKKTLAEKFAPK